MASRILITFAGTRGDAQPYMVAAKALRSAGFETMVAGNEDAESLAKAFGVPFRGTRPSARAFITLPQVVEAFNEQSIPKLVAVQELFSADGRAEREVRKWYQVLVDFQPDLVLAGGTSIASSIALCKALHIPMLTFCLQRWRTSRYNTPFGMPKLPPGCWNVALWNLLNTLLLRGMRKTARPVMEELLQGPCEEMMTSTADILDWASCRSVFCSLISESRALHGDFPPDFNDKNLRLGPMMPEETEQAGPEFGAEQTLAMENFLAAGDPPVFMGFGSMICRNSKFMTLLCLRALRIAGLRGILCAAWSDMSAEHLADEPDAQELQAFAKEKVLFMKFAPHRSLFPRCTVIVHHGGAGTTNASAKSGIPTVILPLSFDQFDHADTVNRTGIGIGLKVMHSLSPADVAEALLRARSPAVRDKAKAMGEAMAKENGPAELVDFVRGYMTNFVKTGEHMKLQEATIRRRTQSWPRWCLSMLTSWVFCR